MMSFMKGSRVIQFINLVVALARKVLNYSDSLLEVKKIDLDSRLNAAILLICFIDLNCS